MDARPPERIELDGVVLRRHRIEDAPEVLAAINESVEELRPWMQWASAAETFELSFQQERLRTKVADSYALVDDADRFMGALGVHDRQGPGALELGYWLRTSCTGRGIMTAAVDAATAVALALPGIERIEIHTDEANHRSAAIPRRLGFRIERITEHAIDAPGESGRTLIWVHPA